MQFCMYLVPMVYHPEAKQALQNVRSINYTRKNMIKWKQEMQNIKPLKIVVPNFMYTIH